MDKEKKLISDFDACIEHFKCCGNCDSYIPNFTCCRYNHKVDGNMRCGYWEPDKKDNVNRMGLFEVYVYRKIDWKHELEKINAIRKKYGDPPATSCEGLLLIPDKKE